MWYLLLLLACGGDTPNRLGPGVDADFDGFASLESGGRDCDDDNPDVGPLTPELCNGVDDNCNGIVDERVSALIYADADGDGFGSSPTETCDPPADALLTGGDCDDTDEAVFPGAPELCDGKDNDCDGLAEQAPPSWWPDTDGDGFGDGTPVSSCEAPEGFVDNDQDCDDGMPDVNPDATEVCNGIDDNCDGQADTDADEAPSYWVDADGDGFGDELATPVVACEQPAGHVPNADDCDDDEVAVNPDAQEICNVIDDDCDGLADTGASDASDWFVDIDGDGYGDRDASPTRSCSPPADSIDNDEDCDDDNADVSPDATEECNGVDDNCDDQVDEGVGGQTWYLDADNDGYGDPASGASACSQPSGTVSNGDDCDDDNGSVKPGAAESCDTIDNDCDGTPDDGACGAGSENCTARTYGSSVYQFCDKPRRFSTALANCAFMPGYHLVYPNSAGENAFLRDEASAIDSDDWWLGVDDILSEGTWRYSGTLTAISYSNWRSGEPNNSNNEDCAELRSDGTWNDQNCPENNRYICEAD